MKTLSLILNNNSNSSKIISKLEEMNFEKLLIDARQNLTFIEIETNEFVAFVSSFLFDGAIKYGLKITKWNDNSNYIKIPFGDLDTISRIL